MASSEDREGSVKALHRMIAYARNEAARLRIADVVLLLGYAEDVLSSIEPEQDDGSRDEARWISILQH